MSAERKIMTETPTATAEIVRRDWARYSFRNLSAKNQARSMVIPAARPRHPASPPQARPSPVAPRRRGLRAKVPRESRRTLLRAGRERQGASRRGLLGRRGRGAPSSPREHFDEEP